MMKKLLIAGLALLPATPAFAQDYPTGGARIELRAGWDNASPVVTYTDDTGSQRISGGRSGLTYGGEVGYDFLVSGPAFVGAYAGVEGSTTKDCLRADTASLCLGAGRNLTVGVRAGYALGHNSMIYMKGGYTNGQARLTYRDSAFPADDFTVSKTLDGFHVGAGGELGLTPHFYTKLEYLYTHYEVSRVPLDDAVLRTTVDRHQVVGGVGYRF